MSQFRIKKVEYYNGYEEYYPQMYSSGDWKNIQDDESSAIFTRLDVAEEFLNEFIGKQVKTEQIIPFTYKRG